MLMLWGLFFYDIFWVYGTDVMITVAKSIDAPMLWWIYIRYDSNLCYNGCIRSSITSFTISCTWMHL